MVEAIKPHWLHPIFTLYIYKVFEHLKMLCIGSWRQPYTADTPAEGWPRFWKIGVTLSGYDAMMSWLRLLSPADCIPLSHYIYKVFDHLKILWISTWIQPNNDTPAEGWPRFWEIGVTLSGYDAMMSWLRLFSTADCIPLSHYIHIKCLSTLRCCG